MKQRQLKINMKPYRQPAQRNQGRIIRSGPLALAKCTRQVLPRAPESGSAAIRACGQEAAEPDGVMETPRREPTQVAEQARRTRARSVSLTVSLRRIESGVRATQPWLSQCAASDERDREGAHIHPERLRSLCSCFLSDGHKRPCHPTPRPGRLPPSRLSGRPTIGGNGRRCRPPLAARARIQKASR